MHAASVTMVVTAVLAAFVALAAVVVPPARHHLTSLQECAAEVVHLERAELKRCGHGPARTAVDDRPETLTE